MDNLLFVLMKIKKEKEKQIFLLIKQFTKNYVNGGNSKLAITFYPKTDGNLKDACIIVNRLTYGFVKLDLQPTTLSTKYERGHYTKYAKNMVWRWHKE